VSFLIDTNIISEVRKGVRCDGNVAAWYATIADEELYLSVLVLGEIRKGAELVRARDASRTLALETWLASIEAAFDERILPIDRAVSDEWGRMAAVRSIPTVDGLLAATAKVHRMTLVTRNTADVADLGAALLNPFETRGRPTRT
jgi:predicted nucleic acid-binding protein